MRRREGERVRRREGKEEEKDKTHYLQSNKNSEKTCPNTKEVGVTYTIVIPAIE